MSANVFEQYQKYYESLIIRHKTNCQLENQNHNHEEAKQPQTQEQQQPTPQQVPQSMSQNPALPQQRQNQQQPQPVQYKPVYMQQQSNWPQSDTDMYSKSPPVQQYNAAAVQMQYNPQKLVCHQPQLYYGPDGSGYYYCSDTANGPLQQQQPQPQFPMQPLYAHCYLPENNCCQLGATFPTVPAAPNTSVHPVQVQQSALPTFKPDGPAEAAAEAVLPDPTPKKPFFCYPYGVNGFQGGFPCSPCSSCKMAPQPNAATISTATTAAPQPCEGNKDCKSGWAPVGSYLGTAAAASGEPISSKADKDGDRLPLGVDEPFVVGPTTYQYFFG